MCATRYRARPTVCVCVWCCLHINEYWTEGEENTQTSLWEIQLSKLPYLRYWSEMMMMPFATGPAAAAAAAARLLESTATTTATKTATFFSPACMSLVHCQFVWPIVRLHLHCCTLHYLYTTCRCQSHTAHENKKKIKRRATTLTTTGERERDRDADPTEFGTT